MAREGTRGRGHGAWVLSFVDTVSVGWRVLPVSIALSMATAFGITLLMTPVYESRAQISSRPQGRSTARMCKRETSHGMTR